MALFNFEKNQKEERKTPVCACGGGNAVQKTESVKGSCSESTDGRCRIKVLGSGCASCHALYENTRAAVRAEGTCAEILYITDLQTVIEYGVMSLPALVVSDKVVSAGKVLKAGEIQSLLRKIL